MQNIFKLQDYEEKKLEKKSIKFEVKNKEACEESNLEISPEEKIQMFDLLFDVKDEVTIDLLERTEYLKIAGGELFKENIRGNTKINLIEASFKTIVDNEVPKEDQRDFYYPKDKNDPFRISVKNEIKNNKYIELLNDYIGVYVEAN